EIEKAVHETEVATHAKVREVLTTAQMARFLVFHEHFHDEVRGILDEARREPGAQGPGQPGANGPNGPPGHGSRQPDASPQHVQELASHIEHAVAQLEAAVNGKESDEAAFMKQASVIGQLVSEFQRIAPPD